MTRSYASPPGGLPDQSKLLTGRAIFTEAYAVMPKATMTDIVASQLPNWSKTRAWILARPLSGFAETFSQYAMEIAPGGGSDRPEPDPNAQGVLFVTDGEGVLTLDNAQHALLPGTYAYIAPGARWIVSAKGRTPLRFQWIRKSYEALPDIAAPESFVTHEDEQSPVPMEDTDGAWTTTRFVDVSDLGHDMHVNIVTFRPGAHIPFAEIHVMEHGLYVLEGRGVYRLNSDWVEVEAGDFLWLRAFCPQACYAGGAEKFRYLLYKNVNRHMPLGPRFSRGA
ncbi:MAG: bifunctional allantoicase/(S)-ureidoglycine aminohydrolase [Pseudomonadota bacterium]